VTAPTPLFCGANISIRPLRCHLGVRNSSLTQGFPLVAMSMTWLHCSYHASGVSSFMRRAVVFFLNE
jgi:hypothetical protein